MDVNTMNTFSFFDGLSMEQVRAAVGMTDNTFNYTLAALRLSHIANGSFQTPWRSIPPDVEGL